MAHDWRTLNEEKTGNTKRDDKTNNTLNEDEKEEETDTDPERNLDELLELLEDGDNDSERGEEGVTDSR